MMPSREVIIGDFEASEADSMVIPAKCGDSKIQVYMDTGASINIISEEQ